MIFPNTSEFENSDMNSTEIDGWLDKNSLMPNSVTHLISIAHNPFDDRDTHGYGLVVGYPKPNASWFLYDRKEVGEKNYYVVGWIQLSEAQRKAVKEFVGRF